MSVEKALLILNDAFDEKQRMRHLEALTEVSGLIAEAQHDRDEISRGLAALSAYDATYTDISFEEGVRRLRERMAELERENTLLRGIHDTTDDVITSAKVALVESVTADHRWHTPEERCPHVRCVALNKIEKLRSG